jgi:toxin ParE1/3/4
MRAIEWSSDALEDFDAAIGYIAIDSEAAATAVADRLFDAVESLADLPTGRQGRVKGTYEKFVPRTSYIVAYAMTGRTITVLRIIHASRDWRADEWPGE